MDKSETSFSLNLQLAHPFLLTLKAAIDDAIIREQELSVRLKSEPVEPGRNPEISIVIGIRSHTGPDNGTGSESDKEATPLLVFRGNDRKTNGLSLTPSSDDNPNGHSVSMAEGFKEAPESENSPEAADELQELTLSESELSVRQREVLELLSQGDSNQDIASKLSISPNTAKTHVRNIMSKLNAANRTQAALAARTLLEKG